MKKGLQFRERLGLNSVFLWLQGVLAVTATVKPGVLQRS